MVVRLILPFLSGEPVRLLAPALGTPINTFAQADTRFSFAESAGAWPLALSSLRVVTEVLFLAKRLLRL